MARHARRKSSSGVYHVIVRGANRQEIFHDEEDRLKFLDILQKYKTKSGMAFYAWCLMGNHVHLLVKEGSESISIVMKRIGVSYANYYNWKYKTTGHLFQDRFKSENVETVGYLLTVTRYIHQNPVKAGIVEKPHHWQWSSCRGYYGQSVYSLDLLDPHYLLRMFSHDISIAQARFRNFNEWTNQDQCLEDYGGFGRRLSDDEARIEIRKCLGNIEIPQLKSLPREDRNAVLRKVKRIEGVSQRQAARILGVSVNLVFKA
ncbi:transposase [[Bacillus] enclensis]|uniref:REP element-mobilizing transposase RayT n=1 Tax=[Bacillus] enclensis TaxID=1402860 RepID=A0A0V8HD39_9BACI|nr:transposase [[Bacillus] enclensis]SCC23957.1 REP element-mobilizing transposase RayT [[Bacillus] enclensis]